MLYIRVVRFKWLGFIVSSMTDRPDSISDAPLSVRMLYPGEYWDEGYWEKKRRVRDRVIAEVSRADVVAVVDADADGLGCEVVVREAMCGEDVVVGVVQAGHRRDVSISEALELVDTWASDDVEVIVADLCPNEDAVDDIVSVARGFDEVSWFDHHEWSDDVRERISSVSRFVHDPSLCATELLSAEFEESIDETIREFARVTGDHDLWKKEDPRSDDLSDYSFWADRDEYVRVAREFGADISESDTVCSVLSAQREEKRERIELALTGDENEYDAWDGSQDGAVWETVETSGDVRVDSEWVDENVSDACLCTDGGESVVSIPDEITIAYLYGEMYSSGAGERAQEEGADVVVVIPPYNAISIRSRTEVPVAKVIATELNGGGHPTSAGGKPNVVGKQGISYDEHWESQGKAVKDHVSSIIPEVVQ